MSTLGPQHSRTAPITHELSGIRLRNACGYVLSHAGTGWPRSEGAAATTRYRDKGITPIRRGAGCLRTAAASALMGSLAAIALSIAAPVDAEPRKPIQRTSTKGRVQQDCHSENGKFWTTRNGSFGCDYPGGSRTSCDAKGSCQTIPLNPTTPHSPPPADANAPDEPAPGSPPPRTPTGPGTAGNASLHTPQRHWRPTDELRSATTSPEEAHGDSGGADGRRTRARPEYRPAGPAPKSIDQQKSECEAKGGTWVGCTDGTSFCTASVGGTIFECDVRGNCSDDPMARANGTRPVLPGANAQDQPAPAAPGPKSPPVIPTLPGTAG